MSFMTIQARLVVSEEIRYQLWNLTANKNTPLVKELFKQVSQHDNFEQWQRTGSVPATSISELCQPLKTDPRFEGQPGRFYTSANRIVEYTYNSWLAIQKKSHYRLNGKRRWLNVVKSDVELVQVSGCNIDTIKNKAQEILLELETENSLEQTPTPNKQKKEKKRQTKPDNSVMSLLFKKYDSTEDVLSRCAIAHLLKNDCQVSTEPEDPEAFANRIDRKKEQIKLLEAQLMNRLPKGRDLTGEEFRETLAIATNQIPENEIQQLLWQAKLLAKPAAMPYPIRFDTQNDLRWSINEKGRICVAFTGLGKFIPQLKKQPFQIYCDRRQLPFFKRFVEDWQTYKKNQDTYPLSLLLFRTASLGWEEGQGKGEPWKVNRLTLHCTLDTQLLTSEGTEKLRQEKISQLKEQPSDIKNPETLTETQQAYIKRQNSTLSRLSSYTPQRPDKALYEGDPEITVGVSIGLACPATAAVVNIKTGKVLAYRSTRQLLGEDYRLLNRQRQKQRLHALERSKNQKKGIVSQISESELGQYVDRLLTKAIIELAQQFQASSIALPYTNNLRQALLAEVNAKARRKSDCKEVQDKYAKQYRMNIHRWSYARLLSNIYNQAKKTGIAIETVSQPLQGTPQEKARDLAIAAYHFRQVS